MNPRGDTDYNTIIIGDFNTPLTSSDTDYTENLQKNQRVNPYYGPPEIYRTFHPTLIEYKYFSAIHVICSMIDHRLGCWTIKQASIT